MSDKRFCGVCAMSGHTSAECPRRTPDGPTNGRRHTEPPPHSIIHVSHTAADHVTSARNVTGPVLTKSNVTASCADCRDKDALIAELHSEVLRLKRGNAERQRAYRERKRG